MRRCAHRQLPLTAARPPAQEGRTQQGVRRARARTSSGWMRPAMMRRMVDFPVPLGPMMPTASPRRLRSAEA